MPVSLSGCCMADLPNLPASSRSPVRSTLIVNMRLRRIIGKDLDVFSTERASRGGSKEIWLSQLAVKILTSPSFAHETAYSPYVKVRSTCFFVFGSNEMPLSIWIV